MKQTIIGLTLMSALILSGCQTSDSSSAKESSSDSALTQSMQSSSETANSTSESQTSSEEAVKESEEQPAAYKYRVNPANSVIEPINADDESKVVLLTFDDAPDEHAVEIATKLKDIGAPAIFFINGMFIESDEGKEKLKEIYDMGFEIGNHTQTHPDLSTLSPEEERKEILETNDLIYDAIGIKPRFFRAPFGITTDTTDEIMAEEKMVSMTWTYGYDWEADYQDATALTDIMLHTEYLNDGANLLMHDRTWTNEAAVDIAEGLKDQGYTWVDPALLESPEREVPNE
ncbi:MAG: polysaccharide deacetylase family protein [Carnobacterium sp.]|uniref:polysaccharide deacetylase family protein n=1 Tax=Carnobacterium sp. TaxID=48221 RepID=UPI002FCB3B33